MKDKNNSFHFRKEKLMTLKAGEGKKVACYYDTKEPGLELRVTSTGHKKFNLLQWSHELKKPIRVPLGEFLNPLGIEEARRLARERKGEITKGEDLSPRFKDRTAPTIADAYKLNMRGLLRS